VPTITSHETLAELGKYIEAACERGDSVSAIAERAGVQRDVISGLRNGTYRYSPTLDKFEAICKSVGVEIILKKS